MGNAQTRAGNKTRKEWFLISKANSLSTPLQHIHRYRKHTMPGLQGMRPPVWKTLKAEETCILHRLQKESHEICLQILWMTENMTSPSLSWAFGGFLLVGWLVQGGWVFVCWGFFKRSCWISPISYFHLLAHENSAVYPAVFLTFNTDVFEKT